MLPHPEEKTHSSTHSCQKSFGCSLTQEFNMFECLLASTKSRALHHLNTRKAGTHSRDRTCPQKQPQSTGCSLTLKAKDNIRVITRRNSNYSCTRRYSERVLSYITPRLSTCKLREWLLTAHLIVYSKWMHCYPGSDALSL